MGIVSINPREAQELVQRVSPHAKLLKKGIAPLHGVQAAEAMIEPLSTMLKLLPPERRLRIEQFAARQLELHTPFSRDTLANKGFIQALRLGKLAWTGEEPHPGFFSVLGKVACKALRSFSAHHSLTLPK